MNHILIAIISFSIFIPAVIGILHLRKISNIYYPFLFLIWVGLINELISFLLIKAGKSNASVGNTFVLVETLLITYQFQKWGLFNKAGKRYPIILIGIFLFWLLENFIFSTIYTFASYFIILRSFLITLMSIGMTNHLLEREKRNIIKNPVFIICICFIVYYTNAILIEAFYLYKINSGLLFQKVIMWIMSFINLLTNLLYALAILWIPTKQRFSFSSSF